MSVLCMPSYFNICSVVVKRISYCSLFAFVYSLLEAVYIYAKLICTKGSLFLGFSLFMKA
jgi:hypothetical protein